MITAIGTVLSDFRPEDWRVGSSGLANRNIGQIYYNISVVLAFLFISCHFRR